MTANHLTEAFDRHYHTYGLGDSVDNARALELVFEGSPLAKTWFFTMYLGIGVHSIESILWLTETFFLNNPDIPL